MKNRTKGFLKSIPHDWYKYLFILLVPVATISFVSENTKQIKNHEKINFFTYIKPKDYSFLDDVKNEFKEHGILDSYIYPYSYEQNEFSNYLESYGFEYSDIVILPEAYFINSKEYMSSVSFHFGSNEYNDSLLNELKAKNPNIKLMNYLGSMYGEYAVKIYEKNNNEYNSSIKINNYFDFEDDMVMIIPKSSDNIATIVHNDIENVSFACLKYLI